MKKAIKYIILAIVWAVVSVALFFAGRGLYSALMSSLLEGIAPNLLIFSEKMPPALCNPEAYKENTSEKTFSSTLFTRGVMADTTIQTDISDLGILAIFAPDQKIEFTTVYAFASKDPNCNNPGFGTWKNIFRPLEEEKEKSSIYNSFALMNLEKATEEGYWAEIQFVHDSDANAVLKLDRYAIRGVECVPIDLTLTSSLSEKTYHPHSDSEFDSSWTICEASDVYVFNPDMETLESVIDHDVSYVITDEIENGRNELNSLIQHVDWNSTGDNVMILKDNTMTELSYQIVSNPSGVPGTYLMATYLSFQCPDVLLPIYLFLIVAWTVAFWGISLVVILIAKAVKK